MTQNKISLENERYKLISLNVCSEMGETPDSSVTVSVEGQEQNASSTGSGAGEAPFKAIEEIVKSHTEIHLDAVKNINSETDSHGEVTVRMKQTARKVKGL